jgi:hypothetical protein
MLEHSWTQEPRGLTEILEAEDCCFIKFGTTGIGTCGSASRKE